MSILENRSFILNNSYCSAIKERYCWPQTAVNHTLNISCSIIDHQGIDSSKYFSRYCLLTGNWSIFNVTSCFYPDVISLLNKSYLRRRNEERESFEKIIHILRYIEFAGLSLSFTSILISLYIFFSIKSLYNNRTKIHINLLLAILIQIIARVVTYGIQMFQLRQSSKHECDPNGTLYFYRKPGVFDHICSLVIIVLQFGITAMFMWMLCEGIHLNTVLTVSVFKKHFKTSYYHLIGWFLPFCLTFSWSMVMFIKERHRRCFNNYNHLIYYWIIDGPRYVVMIINIIFLLNIIRVLLVKIKEGSEKQIREDKRRSSMNAKFVRYHLLKLSWETNARSFRKAVKAAIFLLPLLGTTHFLETFISADDKPLTIFAIYGSVSVLLMTLQGFFCSLLYCFLNGEVREKLSRRFQTTRMWSCWKQYLGKNEQFNNGRILSETQTPNSIILKKGQVNFEEIHLTSNDVDNHL